MNLISFFSFDKMSIIFLFLECRIETLLTANDASRYKQCIFLANKNFCPKSIHLHSKLRGNVQNLEKVFLCIRWKNLLRFIWYFLYFD